MAVVPHQLPGRFSSLLIAVLLLLLLRPFLEGFVVARFLLTALFTATLISALYSLSRPAWAFKVGLALVLPAIALVWLPYAVALPAARQAGYAFTLLAFAFTTVVSVSDTLQATRVTAEQIAGALSAYLLLGLVADRVRYRGIDCTAYPRRVGGTSCYDAARSMARWRSQSAWSRIQNCGDVFNRRDNRSAVSAVIPRLPSTISLSRFTEIPSCFAAST